MRNRTKITKKLQSTQNPSTIRTCHTKLKDIETLIKQNHQSEQAENENKAVRSIKDNPKYFYSYAAKHSKSNSGIGPFLGENNELINDSLTMSEMLQRQYKSAFSSPHKHQIVHNPDEFFSDIDTNNPSLQDFTFTNEDIISAINQIKPSAAPGPDQCSASFLKNCKTNVYEIPFRNY